MFIAGFFIGMVAGIIAWNVALKKPQDEDEEIVIDSDQDVFMRKETAKSGRRK